MKEDFGRKSIAARKAKRARENLAQGKPECYQDEGVARIESKTNGRCADCPVEKDCHLQALLLASLHQVGEEPDTIGDPATLDLDNPSDKCRACPVREDCGGVVYELDLVGSIPAIETPAREYGNIDPADLHAIWSAEVCSDEARGMPNVDRTPTRAEHDSGTRAAAACAVERYGDKHLATPSETAIGVDAQAVPETLSPMPAAAAKTTPKLQPAYSFPMSEAQIDARFTAMSVTELLSELERMCYSRDARSGGQRPYHDIRHVVCAINLELNLRGGCSPSSRPMRKVRKATQLSEEEKLLSNDRQFLDLYWLHCNRRVTAGIHRERFQAEQFDPDWGSDFVQRRGTTEQKARALALRDVDQLLLAAIQTRPVAERRRTIQAGVDSTRQAIADIARPPASRLSPQNL